MGLTRLSYQSNNLTVGSMIGGIRAADGSGEVILMAVGVDVFIIFLEFSINYQFFIFNAPLIQVICTPLTQTLAVPPPFCSSFTTTRWNESPYPLFLQQQKYIYDTIDFFLCYSTLIIIIYENSIKMPTTSLILHICFLKEFT
jgi:hypothetical protein